MSAAAGALFAAGLLRKGVVMGPDSWAYWEGSVSWIQVGTYSYFGGPSYPWLRRGGELD